MFINLEFITFIFVIFLNILAINIHVCGVIELVLWLIYIDGYGLGSESESVRCEHVLHSTM